MWEINHFKTLTYHQMHDTPTVGKFELKCSSDRYKYHSYLNCSVATLISIITLLKPQSPYRFATSGAWGWSSFILLGLTLEWEPHIYGITTTYATALSTSHYDKARFHSLVANRKQYSDRKIRCVWQKYIALVGVAIVSAERDHKREGCLRGGAGCWTFVKEDELSVGWIAIWIVICVFQKDLW